MSEQTQEAAVRSGDVAMALARLPVDRTGLHCIELYQEQVVVAASAEHFVAAAETVTTADLTEEQLVRPHASGWRPGTEQLDWPPMSEAEAIATVAAGTGVVLLPQSIARLHQRKDVVWRPVTDLDPTTVGLIWPTDADDDRIATFIGIVRGRTENSSRD